MVAASTEIFSFVLTLACKSVCIPMNSCCDSVTHTMKVAVTARSTLFPDLITSEYRNASSFGRSIPTRETTNKDAANSTRSETGRTV